MVQNRLEWFRDIVSDMEDMPSDFKLCMSAVLVNCLRAVNLKNATKEMISLLL